jgi:hypothetical protein
MKIRATLLLYHVARRGTVKALFALDKLRPSLSLTWNVRFEPMSVRYLFRPAGG